MQLCFLRHPGREWTPEEIMPAAMVRLIAQQLVSISYIRLNAYYFDSGDSNSVREMGLFCAEIPSKV